MLQAVVEEADWQVDFVSCEWAQCLEWLESGEIDLMGAIAYSEERAQQFDFTTEALIANWGQIYIHPSQNIESFLGLDGKNLAVLKGDIYTSAVMKIMEAYEVTTPVMEVDDYPTVLAKIESGEADAGVVNRLFASLHANEFNVQQTAIIFHPIEVRFAATKGVHQDLLDTIDFHLLVLKNDQESVYYDSMEYWFVGTQPLRFSDWMIWALLGTGILILGLVVANHILGGRVRARTQLLEDEIASHKTTGEALLQKSRTQESLIETAHHFTESLDSATVLQRISHHAKELLGAYGIAAYLLEPDGKTLTPMVAIEPGAEEQVMATPLQVKASFTGQAVLNRRGMIFNQIKSESSGTFIPGTEDYPDERVLVAPFILEGEVYGAMCLNRLGQEFTEDDLVFAEMIAVYGSAALKNARDHSRLQREVDARIKAEHRIQEYADHLEEKVTDRTRKLRKAQERLIRQERLAVLGEMAGGVGHELRDPLGVITNAAYYLKMTLSGEDEKVSKYLDMIDKEAKHAARIISDLLDFAKEAKVDREPTRLGEIIAEVFALHPAPINVCVKLDIPGDLPLVFVESNQIKQVITNLVTNAYQAMSAPFLSELGRDAGGELRIEANELADHVEILISDTGIGIPQEVSERVFEPLYTSKPQGIGLGLAISKKWVEANKGSIRFESEHGVGTTFTLQLPKA
jgi:signal transduction histidine kinase/ABC-type amino acid transport substrate-binding protein